MVGVGVSFSQLRLIDPRDAMPSFIIFIFLFGPFISQAPAGKRPR